MLAEVLLIAVLGFALVGLVGTWNQLRMWWWRRKHVRRW